MAYTEDKDTQGLDQVTDITPGHVVPGVDGSGAGELGHITLAGLGHLIPEVITASQTAEVGYLYVVNSGSGAVTVTLPAAANLGESVGVLWLSGANQVSLAPGASDNIDGAGDTIDLAAAGSMQAVRAGGDDTNWYTVSKTGGGSSGGYQLLSTVSGTTDAEVDLPLPAGYSQFKIVFKMTVGTDNTMLYGRITNDDFSTVESGATVYRYLDSRAYINTGSISNTGSGGDDHIQFTASIGNAAGEMVIGQLEVNLAGDADAYTMIKSDLYRDYSDGTTYIEHQGAIYHVAEAINGLRLYLSSGSFATYNFKIYGLPEA